MAREIRHKRSIGEKLRDQCTNALHSLRQLSNAVLSHDDEDNWDVEDLFNSSDSEAAKDYITVLKDETRRMASKKSKQSQKPAEPNTETATITTPTNPRSIQSISITSNSKTNSTRSAHDGSDPTPESHTSPATNGPALWEIQREEWLTPTVPKSEYEKRKHANSLAKLADSNENVYLGVYRNLVVRNKPLKRGINMVDGFKVIYHGWESSKMFERVASGGVP